MSNYNQVTIPTSGCQQLDVGWNVLARPNLSDHFEVIKAFNGCPWHTKLIPKEDGSLDCENLCVKSNWVLPKPGEEIKIV